MPRTHLYSLLLCLFVLGAQAALVNGPMISHIDMREAKIWVQTDIPSLVRIGYAVAGDDDFLHWTTPVETDNNKAHTAVLTLDKV